MNKKYIILAVLFFVILLSFLLQDFFLVVPEQVSDSQPEFESDEIFLVTGVSGSGKSSFIGSIC